MLVLLAQPPFLIHNFQLIIFFLIAKLNSLKYKNINTSVYNEDILSIYFKIYQNMF